jgi:hypothetical protein
MNRRFPLLIGIAAATLSGASACTWQQAYSASQTWQRNACNKLVEQTERERCLASADMGYDDYRKSALPGEKRSLSGSVYWGGGDSRWRLVGHWRDTQPEKLGDNGNRLEQVTH